MVRWLLPLLLVLPACGRSDLYKYGTFSTPGDGGALDAGLDAGTPDAGPIPCIPGQLSLKKALPTVMFVLDRSGSMNQKLGSVSRWKALTNALDLALPSVSDQMEMGAYVFPTGTSSTSCSVSGETTLAPKLGNAELLIQNMRERSPAGHTPTAAAIATAGTILSTYRAATAARAMVLATDGAPNCNGMLSVNTCVCESGGGNRKCSDPLLCLDDDRTVAEVRGWQKKGVPTYVIGLKDATTPIFEATLNAMAIAGGHPLLGKTESYYAVTSESELDAAMVNIRNQVGGCVYLTTSLPDLNGSIVVRLNGTPLKFESGWIWGNQANGEVVLVGDACLEAAATETPVVNATIGCGGND